MRILAAVLAAFVLLAQTSVSAWAEGPFNQTTMLGWPKASKGAAMAYFRLPLHDTPRTSAQPRFGLMISGPSMRSAGFNNTRVQGPALLDLGITGRNLESPWTASLNVGDAPAWASNPDALPRGTNKHLLESGVSWVAVGLISVGIAAGVLVLVEKDDTVETTPTN